MPEEPIRRGQRDIENEAGIDGDVVLAWVKSWGTPGEFAPPGAMDDIALGEAVAEGVRDADAGDFVEAGNVHAWLGSWGTAEVTPPPK